MRSRSLRLVVVAAAAVAAVVAFAALRPDEAREDRAARTTSPTATGPAGTASTTSGTTAPPAATTGGAPAPPPRLPTVRVRDGEVVGGPLGLEVDAGDEVAFRVSADVVDEVHVHGYDLHRDVRREAPATVRFRARLEGVFEVELHDTGLRIAELRVSPS